MTLSLAASLAAWEPGHDGRAPAGCPDRIRRHLVGLRMPRALETLDNLVQQIERGQLGTIEAIEMLLTENSPSVRPAASRRHSRWGSFKIRVKSGHKAGSNGSGRGSSGPGRSFISRTYCPNRRMCSRV